jgi:hypothetical protein
VLISRDGKVLTAAHLVQTADAIEVELLTGEKLPAKVVSSEPELDLAYLKLDRAPRVPFVASLADSDRVEVGAPVFVIGAPLGLSHTLTVGHISGRHRLDSAAGMTGPSSRPMRHQRRKLAHRCSTWRRGDRHRQPDTDPTGGSTTTSPSPRTWHAGPRGKSPWSGLGAMFSGDLAHVFTPPPGVGLLVQKVAS